ncbi:ABC transporter substrate-binding protein [Patescibacteria group bacterium]|nr:ABC transporter substrate-binding protein [Patescibacteria group bacterium]
MPVYHINQKLKLLLCRCFAILVLLYAAAITYAQDNYPQRIISLGSAITEELYILGIEDRLIGCSVYCQKPLEAKRKEKVGTAIEVNLEKIVALRPDLVLATSLTTPKAKEKLKNLGIKVVTFAEAKNFSEICEHFLELGRIVGKENEAKTVIGIARDKVDSVKNKVKEFEKPKVFIQLGTRPLVTVTKDSFVNDFIEFAGGINSAQGSKNNRYSREKVLKDDPDVIIIVTMGLVGKEEKEIWRRYKSLKAVKNNRIYIVDSDNFCSPTPLSFVQALEEMAKILHLQNG